MRIRLTNPAMLDKVLTKLDEDWPIGKENQTFLKYCVEPLKEKIANGQTVILEAELGNMGNGVCYILSYWTLDEVPTDEEFLNNGNE